jgi:beta-glucosidase
MKQYGIDTYRMSLSWSRIIPEGACGIIIGAKGSPVNRVAIDHYNQVFSQLLDAGITPFVTLYHWDMPQALYSPTGGILDTETFPVHFVYYADVVFREFGDQGISSSPSQILAYLQRA